VESTPGPAAYISCLLIALVFFPLMCLPFCVDGCQDIQHVCPACGVVIRSRGAFEDY